jgi:Right handed beta helix region/RTX calcium-binding nonapeptide repeat (4 copies)
MEDSVSVDPGATLGGFPDADSTGVRPGVTLTPVGETVITTDGTVVSGLEVHGALVIDADNVTVVDCKIVSDDFYGVEITDGHSATVEHCDISGGQTGIGGMGTFRFNDISDCENGIDLGGSSLIEENYIHDLSGAHSPNDPHIDGIQIDGDVTDTVIRHNTVINQHTQTSAIMIQNSLGPVSNVVINDNYLAGGGYTVYSDARFSDTDQVTGVKFTNNYLGKGFYGYYAIEENDPVVAGDIELGRRWPTPVSNLIEGGNGNDNLTGNDDDNTIHGGSGNDLLRGNRDTDTISGEGGNDIVFGGSGGTRARATLETICCSSSLERTRWNSATAMAPIPWWATSRC